MMTNQFLYQSYQSGDPARLGVQVINGIGFLGAGTIIVTKRNQIKGLTTAAGLWTSACAGLALGIGLYEVAAPACLSIFVIFTVLLATGLCRKRRLGGPHHHAQKPRCTVTRGEHVPAPDTGKRFLHRRTLKTGKAGRVFKNALISADSKKFTGNEVTPKS